MLSEAVEYLGGDGSPLSLSKLRLLFVARAPRSLSRPTAIESLHLSLSLSKNSALLRGFFSRRLSYCLCLCLVRERERESMFLQLLGSWSVQSTFCIISKFFYIIFRLVL